MVETFYNYKLKKNEVTHHKDFTKNNFMENFQVMTKGEHRSIHNKERLGENNPMFGVHRYGEKSAHHTLKEQDVLDIRKSLELKLYTQKQLSWMFNVSRETISHIKIRRVWKHLK